MEGFGIVLGKDWLDMVNHLIDWHSNRMYIRQGDQLHIVLGDPNVQPCGIKDRGLNGLQDNFSLLHKSANTDLQFGRWGALFAQLASPQFWEYQASHRQWTQSSSRKVEQPQGEVQAENSANESKIDTGPSRPRQYRPDARRCRSVGETASQRED